MEIELPQDVLKIIKEYAMPITRSDWKRMHLMTNKCFYLELIKLRDNWFTQDTLFLRRKRGYRLLNYDRLMRYYILRYRICYLADFEFD